MAGRVAIVTGSGQGLGEEIALALSQRGYRLALFGRTASKVERVAGLIGADALPLNRAELLGRTAADPVGPCLVVPGRGGGGAGTALPACVLPMARGQTQFPE